MEITESQLAKLRPLLEGSGPSEKGWWNMHCPYHKDANRSAGISVTEGVFRCHGCGEYKTIAQLLKDRNEWNVPVTSNNRGTPSSNGKPKEVITEGVIEGWHSALLSNQKRLNALMRKRGLSIETIIRYELGWDSAHNAYTIPIRDSSGTVMNVRRYQLDVPEGRRKIWSVDGMGTPVLYPVDQLDHPSLVVCEGEMDALLTIQNGIPAITRTGAADVWKPDWSHAFNGKNVYICHDMDTKGQKANNQIYSALRDMAKKVQVVTLPYEVTEDHGKDLSDFWLEGAARSDFIDLIKGQQEEELEYEGEDDEEDEEPELVSVRVIDSFDATMVEKPLRMSVTVIGKRTPSYLVPEKVQFTCMEVDSIPAKCKHCSLVPNKGRLQFDIRAEDDLILRLFNVPDDRMIEIISKEAGIVKCPKWKHVVGSRRTVEEVFVRPSIEDGPTDADQDFTHRQVISSATHDLTSNESVVLTGTIRPNPRTQANEFQAWKVDRPETGLDHFYVSDSIIEEMYGFQTDDPLGMMNRIAADLSTNYTKIVGRDLFHVFVDLVFHSIAVVDFPFPGHEPEKGWLDAIAIGDTRTGKSAVASAMIKMYGAGEHVSCEAATFAGVVGGLDRVGDKNWVIKWGVIPINDRRVAVLDEVSGLTTEQISQMSNMRSSGTAELTKIHSERARARTRLLWLGNPRGETMDSVAYGIDALRKLIGNAEDIARFDMAMGVFSSDVAASTINTLRPESKRKMFSVDAYRGLLRWAWTRKGSDVQWRRGAAQRTLDLATKLGETYVETPPLIQGANAQMKLARIAAAMAARTYSTSNGQNLQIHPHHVEAAYEFLNKVYSHTGFGYEVVSKQRVLDRQATERNIPALMDWLSQNRQQITRFLINSPTFSKFQAQSFLNMSDEEAATVINKLWSFKAVEMFGDKIRVSPLVLAQLRGRLLGEGVD